MTAAAAICVLDRILRPGQAAVMGIVNCTPDSFYDGGCYPSVQAAVDAGLQMREDGAVVLDIGGESTRPGADTISTEEEIQRVCPVIEQIRNQCDIPISVDTSKAEVAHAALCAGADIINDVTALTGDPAMAALAATSDAPIILMHMRGTPQTMQHAPQYPDVVTEVKQYLSDAATQAEGAGISRKNIILDPGFGFGKTLPHNAALLMYLRAFAKMGYPILVGLSRKSMIEHALGLPKEQRLEASLALAIMAVLHGAAIVRVHDVKETVRAIGMINAIQNAIEFPPERASR